MALAYQTHDPNVACAPFRFHVDVTGPSVQMAQPECAICRLQIFIVNIDCHVDHVNVVLSTE